MYIIVASQIGKNVVKCFIYKVRAYNLISCVLRYIRTCRYTMSIPESSPVHPNA